jgi:delta1-piperideine-2-carboxylate reductase
MTDTNASAPETLRVTFDELTALLARIFERNKVRPETAHILAENCALCERDGSTSHGIFRMKGYLGSLNSGWVDGMAVPTVEDAAPAFCRADAHNGFAQTALAAARPLALEKAKANGAAILAIRNSHHMTALWPDIEPFAREGLIAISVVNSFQTTVPYGAKAPVFGTNPIAFAAPRDGADPIVFDMATSAVAHGDVQIAAREGHSLPEGYGVDAEGRPTTDPKAVLNGGALLTFGGHKGSAISMMIELLSAALTGGHYSWEFDWSAYPGAATPHTGQLIILIDPRHAGGLPFTQRADGLVAKLREAGLSRMPGERRYRNRKQAERDGIEVSRAAWAELESMAQAQAD